MPAIERLIDDYRHTVQAHVPDEPVLAVGVLSRPGSLSTSLLVKLSPLAALFRNRHARGAAGGLPQNVVAAVTPTRVLFFSFRPKMQSIVVRERVGELPRAGLVVTALPGSLATRLTFHTAHGDELELDSNRNMGVYRQLNDGLLGQLGVVLPAA